MRVQIRVEKFEFHNPEVCPEIEVDLEIKPDKFEVDMESLDVLKRIPQEHYTQYKGKCIMVKDLVKIIEEEIKKEKREKKRGNGGQ